jgi:hypothetical protein
MPKLTTQDMAQKMTERCEVSRTRSLVTHYIRREGPENLPAELVGGRYLIDRDKADTWLDEVWLPKSNRWHRDM